MLELLEIALSRPEAIDDLRAVPQVLNGAVEQDPPFEWKGHPLGRLLPASVVTWPRYRLRGLPEPLAERVQTWRLLPMHSGVIHAYSSMLRQPHAGGLDLGDVLERVLASQPEWVVWCIYDPDQSDEHRAMTVPEVVRQVRENVLGSPAARNFVAWSSASSAGGG